MQNKTKLDFDNYANLSLLINSSNLINFMSHGKGMGNCTVFCLSVKIHINLSYLSSDVFCINSKLLLEIRDIRLPAWL